MGKVLCDSCKIERRSNVIQRLFKRSCIIAKAFLSPQEKRTARVSGGIFVSTSRKSSTISFEVGMSANFSIKHPRVVFTIPLIHGSRLWNSSGEVQQKGLIPCLRRKKKNEWWTRPSSDFLLSNFCVTFRKLVFFSVLLESSNRLCTPWSWTTVFLFTLYQPYHFYIMYLLIIILILSR